MAIIKVIIPAFNEEKSIGKVIQEIPKTISEIIVVNNNSTDSTEKQLSKMERLYLLKNEKATDMLV